MRAHVLNHKHEAQRRGGSDGGEVEGEGEGKQEREQVLGLMKL